MKKGEILKKVVQVFLLLTMALSSFFVVSKPAMSPETYTKTIQAIDDKKATVMTLTAAAATASTIIAAAPDDATTPIANQIMKISEYLFIVVCFLVLEKYLLTVMGFLSFKLLIPAALLILILCVFVKKDTLKMLAKKMIVFALVLVSMIPFSVRISDMMYEMNRDTVDIVITDIEEEDNEQNKGFFGDLLNKIKNAVSNASDYAKKVLNGFIDAIAVFVITYLVMPIGVVFVVIWFINFLFGIPIPYPKIPFWSHKNKEDDRKEDRKEGEV